MPLQKTISKIQKFLQSNNKKEQIITFIKSPFSTEKKAKALADEILRIFIYFLCSIPYAYWLIGVEIQSIFGSCTSESCYFIKYISSALWLAGLLILSRNFITRLVFLFLFAGLASHIHWIEYAIGHASPGGGIHVLRPLFLLTVLALSIPISKNRKLSLYLAYVLLFFAVIGPMLIPISGLNREDINNNKFARSLYQYMIQHNQQKIQQNQQKNEKKFNQAVEDRKCHRNEDVKTKVKCYQKVYQETKSCDEFGKKYRKDCRKSNHKEVLRQEQKQREQKIKEGKLHEYCEKLEPARKIECLEAYFPKNWDKEANECLYTTYQGQCILKDKACPIEDKSEECLVIRAYYAMDTDMCDLIEHPTPLEFCKLRVKTFITNMARACRTDDGNIYCHGMTENRKCKVITDSTIRKKCETLVESYRKRGIK